MAVPLIIQFRPGVSVVRRSDRETVLESQWGQMVLNDLTPALLDVFQSLSSDGATEDDLTEILLGREGSAALPFFYYYLDKFGTLSMLRYTLPGGEGPLATIVPMCGAVPLSSGHRNRNTRVRLSRFAYWRRDGDTLVLETPLVPVRTLLHGPSGAAALAALVHPRSCRELCLLMEGLDEETAHAFLDILTRAGIVAEVDEDGNLVEDADPALAQWEFHDLLFHTRSRPGRHDYPFGGTFRFLGAIAPLPAVKPKMSADVVALHVPDLTDVEKSDPPFTRVLETRRSVRRYGEHPMSGRQLGEFRYRVARLRLTLEPEPEHGLLYEASNRPYPSGGAVYELELYVTVNSCDGVSPGLYHYDPVNHQLERLADRGSCRDALLRDAQLAVRLTGEPQILIAVTSRFQRVSWKYCGFAYALTLNHVGVLYQTMYLVATAMGLAPCAVGTGNADLFAEATETNYFSEALVGTFLLGSAPEPDTSRVPTGSVAPSGPFASTLPLAL